ncbi:MAG: diadenylate cyclase [Mycoplasmoidaceae bacterium]
MNSEIMNVLYYIFFVVLVITTFILLYFTIRTWKNSESEINKKLGRKSKDENEETERLNVLFRESVLNALGRMSEHKIGALIAIENNDDLSFYEQSGYQINGTFSPEFVMGIFSNKKSALHDGAIIIRDRKIISISSYLPMTKNTIDVKYGARHRAAIGLSEKTDALVFVVSETNGNISYALNGLLHVLPNNNKERNEELDIILR